MVLSRSRIRVTVVQLGPLAREEIDNVLDLATQTQRAFDYVMHPRSFARIPPGCRLPNTGWDLDAAVRALLSRYRVPRPVIFFTSAPYSDWDSRRTAGQFYFAGYSLDDDPSVAIVSTHLWTGLSGPRPLQPYVFLCLATAALTYTTNSPFHFETRGCVFDYCDESHEIDKALATGAMCDECDRYVHAALRAGQITIEQLAAVQRLLNRAVGKRQAFVIMPFRRDLNPVHKTLCRTLGAAGWHVVRADQVSRPRRITDAILHAILSSDLVVADLTGGNPNVFYELGFAHAAGCDVILITQEKIPFDVTVERAIIYRPTRSGLTDLAEKLTGIVG